MMQPSHRPFTLVPFHRCAQVLRERGLVQEVTSDEMEAAAAATSLSVYCGFDPTADSLHLGNLLGIIVLSWFQKCGHAPVALLGGATGAFGFFWEGLDSALNLWRAMASLLLALIRGSVWRRWRTRCAETRYLRVFHTPKLTPNSCDNCRFCCCGCAISSAARDRRTP